MKPLFWNRIQIKAPNQVVTSPVLSPDDVDSNDSSESSDISQKSKCLWDNIDDNIELINDEFVGLFSRQVPQKKKKAKEEEKPKKKTKQVANIIDSKKSHNVGILVTSLRLEISDIEAAVYNFDTSVVDCDRLQQILEVVATKEELEMISKHMKTKPDIPLAKAEQFLYDLSQIHEFADRVHCIVAEVKFGDQLSSIESRLNNFKMLCQSLTTSKAIKEIFAIILTLGNYMNGGHRDRGQADGFGLDVLPKLRDVKGNQAISLLEYVVKTWVKRVYPDILSLNDVTFPLPEPSDLDKASAIVFDDIVADINKMEDDIKSCVKRVEKITKSPPKVENPENDNQENQSSQHFEDRINSFIKEAERHIKEQNENVDDCKRM